MCTNWAGPVDFSWDPFFRNVQLQHHEDCDSVTLFVHAGLFWRFHNPSISYMDYRICNVRMGTFFFFFLNIVYTGGLDLYIISTY